MLLHSLGLAVIFFFGALYCSCLGFNALLDCNKGIKFKKAARKCCYEIKINAQILISGEYSYNWGFIGQRVTESKSYRVTDNQGYSVRGG